MCNILQISKDLHEIMRVSDELDSLLRNCLTGRFSTVSYALVPACAKLAHFGL